jgi:hypothetical protein
MQHMPHQQPSNRNETPMTQTAYQFKERVIENLDALIERKTSNRPNSFHMLKHFTPEQLQEIRRFVNSFEAETAY